MAIITISRGTMSGGDALAACLSAKLGYPSLSREVLVESASKLGLSEEKLRWAISGSVHFWERWHNERRLYLIALQAALAQECLSGNLIYHGNAGHLLLKGLPNLLRVRLIATLEVRIRNLMEKEGMKYEAAKHYINCADKDRIEWTKFLYGVDWHDPELYDVVVNLEQINLQAACSMIVGAVDLRRFKTTPNILKALADFALGARVKLALAANTEVRNVVFEVRADSGRVEILGETASAGVLVREMEPSQEGIETIAKTVEGIREVIVNLHRIAKYPDS